MALYEIYDKNGGAKPIPQHSNSEIEAYIVENQKEPYYLRVIDQIGCDVKVVDDEVQVTQVNVNKLTDAQRNKINQDMAAAAYFASLREAGQQ